MKTRSLLLGALMSILAVSCQKDQREELVLPVVEEETVYGKGSPGTCTAESYNIVLESRTFNGSNWEWVWSIQNMNPGNGNGGTTQDLSNWGMQFGSCFNFSSLVGAAYSADGTTWTSFTPVYAPNPSQNCLTTAVLKFDFGTTGSNKSYYRINVTEDYPPGTAAGYVKSGNVTGCCNILFMGVGCTGGPTEERSGK